MYTHLAAPVLEISDNLVLIMGEEHMASKMSSIG